MKVIGITGGAGAGKSEILNYLQEKYRVKILKADLVAHELQAQGSECYYRIVETFGSGILDANMEIDRKKLAESVFADSTKLKLLNAIIHPQVKAYILAEIEKENRKNANGYFFIEAALLIEEKYDLICDELWYVFATEEVRRKRLKESRGYTDEKINHIFQSQLNEEIFRQYCKVIIDNSGEKEQTFHQIDLQMEGK